ncbi:MAG: peptidoglycan editing factor PgeF [Methylohalobius sp.]|nr:peptidoglycan editing factor PgeF [Methylohalobius sp.]
MNFIFPDWPAPEGVRAAVTLRTGGVSRGPYASWNLAAHVGDDPEAVASNRKLLTRRLNLPYEPIWLKQVHGNQIVAVGTRYVNPPEADACFASSSKTVCAVLTADCLPILLTDGHTVAAIHAGWRGMLAGVIEQALTVPPWRKLPMAWLGPAIGPQAFAVGPEVQGAFRARCPDFASAFYKHGERYLADLYHLAKLILKAHRVRAIYGGNFCTYSEPQRFFSYRRDGVCGRMATLIWRD